MKKLYYLFVLLFVFMLTNVQAQRVIPSPRHKPTPSPVPAPQNEQIAPTEIRINPPAVIHFQQLADSEAVHPPKKKKRFIEQGEDREKEFKFRGLPVEPNSLTFDVPPAQNQHQRNSPAPTGIWDGVMQQQQLIPPDIRGAAGPTYVMETTNQHFKIYTKTGTLTSTLSITTFFNSSGGSGYFDPHILYDPNNSRFVVCIAGNVSNGNSGLFVAVSQTSNPTGAWYVYGFDAVGNASDFLDYPLLGLNTNWVVMTGNDFLGAGGVDSKIYVLNRASLYSGTLGTVNTFTDANLFTIAPAQTFDVGQTTEYLVTDYNGNSGGSGFVRIGSITGAVNAPVYNTGTNLGVTQPWSENSVGASQLGNANALEDGDTRIGNAVYINNSLWFCNTVFLPAANPTHDGVDWWQVNPVAPAIQQFGRIEDTNGPKFFYYPSIAVNTNGDALLGYCESSSAMYSGAAYSFHASTDAANTMQTTYLYKAGTAGYYQTLGGGRNRWGDFTGSAVDPSDNSFWGFGQWAAGSATWGTEIVHVAASSTICAAQAAFTNSTSVACSAPFTVNFTNNSSSANTYVWYFGDGTTSTADNPSHTYTQTGIYSVKLVATSSGTCGRDSITISNLVNIGPANPCIVIMPPTGSASTQTSCTGIVYDDGGLSANYTDNTNSTVTISPVGASQVTLHFTQFAMENTYDFVYVYDGPTIASPQIGAFTGTTIPADVTSSGSSITIRQSTDPAVEDVGFTINWSCIIPNSPPVTNLTADFTSSCSGTVPFTDLTTGGATSWLWNFGDGTTSTLQNPTHTYTTNGTFTVTLTATNAFGSNMVTKASYITISKPSGPTVTSDASSSCGPRSFVLTATTGGNPVSWYNNAGAKVAVSNIYTTPVVSSTTTYYAEDSVVGSSVHVGPVNNLFGTGAYLNASQYEIFNVMKDCILQSVYVNANGAGNRTFQLRDKSLNVIASQTINVPTGYSRVTLNFNLTVGDSFQLGFPTGTTINLYRNDASATYPYSDLGGNVSIIGNTANLSGRYYFCYDWIIQEKCISLRSPVTLTINPVLTATVSATDVSCFGGTNGTATATPSGGTSGFTYHWNNNATAGSLSNLVAGTYSVTVADAVGCSALASHTVAQPTALSASAAATNVSCQGGNNGSIALTVSGGTTTYTYNWGSGITSQNRSGLTIGTYNVIVTDANLCTGSAFATITQPAAIIPSATVTNVSCYGGSNGTINLSVSGGTAGYSFNWGGGITSQNRTGLTAIAYTVTITDANSCTATSSSTLTQPTAIVPSATVTDVSCNGGNDGTINLSVSGGTAGYSFNWGGGITSQNRTGLIAGTYTTTITDANSCTAASSVSVGEPAVISITLTPVGAPCSSSTGSVNSSVSGGTPGYSYAWNTGGTTSSISGLAVGNYNVIVTDTHNCSATASTTVTNSGSLTVTGTSVNANCFGGLDGSASINVSNGTLPLTYIWSNGGNTSSITNVAAGTYTITITDGTGCSATSSQTVSEPVLLSIAFNPTDASCNLDNGSVASTPSGGNGGYSYLWSNSENSSSVSNLSPGNYSVTVTDSHSCTATNSTTIINASSLVANVSSVNATCFGTANGTANVNITNGTQPYIYLWSNGGNSSSITNLPAGKYFVTITDGSNCQHFDSVTITEPDSLSASTIVTNVLCFGGVNGSAFVVGSGGTASYSYQWCNGNITSGTNNLSAGNCSVTITDTHGCTTTSTALISEPGEIQFTTSVTDATTGINNGSAVVTSSGGTSPYTIHWSNGGDGTNLSAGTYSFTITDNNGCTKTGSAVVNEVTGLNQPGEELSFSVHPNPATDEVFVVMKEWKDKTSISLKDVLGQTLLSQTLSSATTVIDVSRFAAGVYLLEVKQGEKKSVQEIVVSR